MKSANVIFGKEIRYFLREQKIIQVTLPLVLKCYFRKTKKVKLMFLALTADQRFWKTDEKILFLGEWCRLYRCKSTWSILDGEVLPYHWDDREKYQKDYIYVDATYEKYLSRLSGELNRLNGVNYSVRYWRIVIGPWLYFFIGIFYDRFLSIQSALDSMKATCTWIPPLTSYSFVPDDFSNMREWYWGDAYNHFLYGRIIKASEKIPYEIKVFIDQNQKKLELRRPFQTSLGKRVTKRILEKVGKWIPSDLNKVVFVSSYLNAKDLIRLQLSLGQFPNPCMPMVKAKKVSTDPELRKNIKLCEGVNLFEKELDDILPEQIPKAYLEGYRDLNQRAMAAFPKKPKVIYTANGFWGNEGFNFWTAAQVEHGATLVASQHGGCYGMVAWSTLEAHETQVSDCYFSWGWEQKEKPKVIPLSSGQLAGLMPSIKPTPNGPILWVGVSVTRYSSQLVSVPMSRQMLDYMNDQLRFVQAVSPEVHKLMIRRLFPIDYDWDEELRWKDMDPQLNIYQGQKTMYQQLNESRLCIGTYNSTTDLETLSRNYPTITYFNPKLNELRESAQPYFDELRRVGIYHETPESAASKVNEVYADPQLWWNSSEVQDIRKKFCHRFARTSENWMPELKKELLKLIKE